MKTIRLTRDSLQGLLQTIYRNNMEYIRLQLQVNKQGEFRFQQVTYEQGQPNIIYTVPMVRILNQLGIPNTYGKIEETYQSLTGEHKKRVEDAIYYLVNQKCDVINLIGFVGDDELTGYVAEILQRIKESQLPVVKELSFDEIGVVDMGIVESFQAEYQPYINNAVDVTKHGFKQKRDMDYYTYALKLTSSQTMDSRDRTFLERYQYIAELLKGLKKARTKQVEVFYHWVKELKLVHKLTVEQINKVLKSLLNILTQTRGYVDLVPYYGRKLKEFAEQYEEGHLLQSIQPITVKGRPYILVEGDVASVKYRVNSGNYYYDESFARKRGVKELEDGKYVMTFNAFRDFYGESEVYDALKFTDYLAGDWDCLYETQGEYFFNITPKFIKSVQDGETEFTLYQYNKNKESNNSLGMKIPYFTHTFLGYNSNYRLGEDDDDHYDLLKEIRDKVSSGCGFTREFNYFKQGYHIRNGSLDEELGDITSKHEHTANRLAMVYNNNKGQLLAAFNQRFGTQYESLSDIKESDFKGQLGLDSGFVFLEFEDDSLNEEARAIRNRKGTNEFDITSKVNIEPMVQSLTLKRVVYDKLVYLFNLDASYKIKVRYELD